jgi:predicted RecA/RadA family phage recombinase
MATTYRKSGHTRRHVNATGSTILSGTLIVLRAGASGECGIAVDDIPNTETGDVYISGVHELTAATGAITNHALVYRNSSNAITTTATSNTLAGVAVAAKTTAATSIHILLNGRPGAPLND